VQIQENRQNIEALKVEVAAFEGRLEKQLASIQKENNDMKVMLAEISTDIKWIKDHKDHKEQ
jgi:hypothetical protein